jgi:hypothetical protein
MDEVAEYNVRRWRALAEGGALYTRPMLDLEWLAFLSVCDPPA